MKHTSRENIINQLSAKVFNSTKQARSEQTRYFNHIKYTAQMLGPI